MMKPIFKDIILGGILNSRKDIFDMINNQFLD